MRKKILSTLIYVGLLSSLTACQSPVNEELVLKVVDNYNGEYTIGQPIDIGYFFYCSQRNSGKVTVTYKGIGSTYYTDEIIGEAFWPKYTGNHEFTYTVGDKTISHTIEVLDQKPTLNVDTYAYISEPSDKIYFQDIFSEISCDYTPDSAYIEVDKVERCDFSFDIDHPDYVYEEIDFREKYFDGSSEGFYKIHISAVSGVRRAPGVINAIITTKNSGNENILKINGKYASNNAVCDPTNPNRYILPASRYNSAAYITLKELKGNDDVISIKFKGKQMPQFGVFTKPNEITNSFSPYAISDGYLFSLQNPYTDRYSIYRGTYQYKTAYRQELYYGLDNLDSDKYYLFTYSFDSHETPDPNNPTGNPYLHVIRWKVQEIYNVNTPDESYSDPLFVIDSEGGWFDKYKCASGYATIYSSALQDITFEVVESKK